VWNRSSSARRSDGRRQSANRWADRVSSQISIIARNLCAGPGISYSATRTTTGSVDTATIPRIDPIRVLLTTTAPIAREGIDRPLFRYPIKSRALWRDEGLRGFHHDGLVLVHHRICLLVELPPHSRRADPALTGERLRLTGRLPLRIELPKRLIGSHGRAVDLGKRRSDPAG